METVENLESLPPAEVAELCALDSEFYSQYFFPKTARKRSPEFHRRIDAPLDDQTHRYVSVEIFRGGAKTSKLRLYTSKRIAYGISRTILYVSETQDHAKRSVRWLRRQVKFNYAWAQFYGLEVSSDRYSDEWTVIKHSGVDPENPIEISVIAVGITGQTRGINIDDFRPDLIIVDDPCNEENTNTPEGRKKISDLFFGSLQKSLETPSENPDAKMVLLQTPLRAGDLITSCAKDPQWFHMRFSCFTDEGESRWPERFPTDFLRAEKQAHINRNQLSLWMREMECKITSEATSHFREEWLRYWDVDLPERMVTFLYIDPVPPPSPTQEAQGLKDKDYEAIAVVGYYRGKYYLCDLRLNRGHDPTWTVATFWTLVEKWNPLKARVESVGYQRTLKWLLEQSMRQRGRYIQMAEHPRGRDRRSKSYRIVDALTGPASSGMLFVNRAHGDFIAQFIAYPDVEHDDAIESVAEALKLAGEFGTFIEVEDYEILDEEPKPQLGYAP